MIFEEVFTKILWEIILEILLITKLFINGHNIRVQYYHSSEGSDDFDTNNNRALYPERKPPMKLFAYKKQKIICSRK